MLVGKDSREELSKMKKKRDAFWKATMPKQEVQLCINRLYATLYLNVAFLCRRSSWSGQNIRKRFYWEGMSNDIRNYIKSCDVCQRTNDAKFVKAGYELHPIPVKPVVWNMV